MPQLTGSALARRRTMVGMYGCACGFGTNDGEGWLFCAAFVFGIISSCCRRVLQRMVSSSFRSKWSKPVAYKISDSSLGKLRTPSASGNVEDDGVDARERATRDGVEEERVEAN